MSRATVTNQPTCSVEPIEDCDLEDVCAFWRHNFRSRGSQETWLRAFQRRWSPDKPNNGFLLRHGGQIVGAIGAIYSQQNILTREEKFCNLTSWYVLHEYRRFSVALLLALIKQKEYHFTTFTANPTVTSLLLGAGFEPLSPGLIAVPNLALPIPKTTAPDVVDTPDGIAPLLSDARRRICLDHADCIDIRQLAVGSPNEGYCHILFSKGRCRNLPCALVHDLSDCLVLRQFWRHVSWYLLRAGCLATRIESRLLAGCRLPYSVDTISGSIELFYSPSLAREAITPLYSEVMALWRC
jgi:hypothetical protein